MRERLSPLAVHVVRIHYRHWGHYSGFNQFVQYLDPAGVRPSVQRVPLQPNDPRWLDRLSKKIAERIARGRCVNWYTTLDLAADALVFAQAATAGMDVVHYLDGDHSLGYLPALLRNSRLLRRRPRVVVTFHQPPDWLADIVRAEHLRSVDRITVVSRDQQEFFERLAPHAPVTWIPHGIDVEFFRPAQDAVPDGTFRCIVVGSWFRDHEFVLRLAERLRAHAGIEFHLVSSGVRGPVPANVVLHERVGDEALRRLYQQASVLLLPLKNATANNALLEGIACGLPAIVTDLPAVRDYVPGEEAIRIAKNRIEPFESAILRIRRDPELRARLSGLARERALTFDWRRIAPRIEEVYREVCAQDRERAKGRAQRAAPARAPETAADAVRTPRPAGLAPRLRRVFLAQWWFADAGGMEQHTANLACALKHAGIEVVVFTQMPMRRGSPYARQLRETGIPVIGPPAWLRGAALSKGARKAIRRVLWVILSPLICAERLSWRVRGYPGDKRDMVDAVSDIVYCDYSRRLARHSLDREQRRRPADLVHVHGFRLDHVWALRWARERGVPSVYTEHGTVSDWGSLWEEDAPEGLLAADVITCVSDRARESLYDFIPRTVPVKIVPHIVAGLGGPRPPRDAAILCRGPRISVTCFGRLHSEKGAEHLVRAMREVVEEEPLVHLTLAGDGPDREKLRNLAAEFGLQRHVRFRGGFAPKDLAGLMEETDVVALPSLTEGLPLALSEAMAFGKPIVATRVGGIPERVRNEENGLLVPPGDGTALAGGILRLARDAGLRSRLGAAARRDYEAKDLRGDGALTAVLGFYDAALEKKRSGTEDAKP